MLEKKKIIHFTKKKVLMLPVGFEPTHPKILQLECNALDHSAIAAIHEFFPQNSIYTYMIYMQLGNAKGAQNNTSVSHQKNNSKKIYFV